MQKYWTLITVIMLITLSIGTFYVQSTLSKNEEPPFIMKKQSGDESMLKPLILAGVSYDANGHVGLRISNGSSSYLRDGGFVERLNQTYQPKKIQRLQQDYRHFMRGKTSNSILYYETDEQIAYAEVESNQLLYNFINVDVNEFTFNISVLDKQSNKETSFELPVPDEEKYTFIDVEGVQIIQGNLKVITRNYVYPEDADVEEIHVYTFNLDKQELMDDESVYVSDPDESGRYNKIDILREESEMTYNQFVVWTNTVIETEEVGDQFNEKIIEEEVYIYDLETGKSSKIEFPNEINIYEGQYMISDSVVYFSNIDGGKLEITPYFAEKDKFGDHLVIDLEDSMLMSDVNLNINQDKLYLTPVFVEQTIPSPVIIASLKTGDVLYKGTIINSNPMSKDNVNFDTVEFE